MELVQEMIRVLDIPGKEKVALHERPFWRPPAEGVVKVNTDIATQMATRESGGSMIARDNHGSFLAARYKHYLGTTSPLVGEALACRNAMLFCFGARMDQCSN